MLIRPLFPWPACTHVLFHNAQLGNYWEIPCVIQSTGVRVHTCSVYSLQYIRDGALPASLLSSLTSRNIQDRPLVSRGSGVTVYSRLAPKYCQALANCTVLHSVKLPVITIHFTALLVFLIFYDITSILFAKCVGDCTDYTSLPTEEATACQEFSPTLIHTTNG